MRRVVLISIVLSMALATCRAAPAAPGDVPARKLTVFAAASLTGALQEIGKGFEGEHPGVRVAFSFGGSQSLRTQIEQGAPADVFASADRKNMDTMLAEGLLAGSKYEDVASNKLVVIMPKANPANIQSLQDLAKPGVKLDLADPSVPVGGYARQVLSNIGKDAAFGADFSDKVLANVISNETDVKQVVAKVDLGEADAGIVYVTDARATPDVKTLAIPDRFNVLAKYPIAALAKSQNADLAAAFVSYVLSPAGQDSLRKWGFGPAAP